MFEQIEALNISVEKKTELTKLAQLKEKEQLKSQLENLRDHYKNESAQFIRESQSFFKSEDDYLCRGRPADAEIQLPLGTGKNGLNAAAMLKQMRKIVDSGYDYDLYTHNCSSTALSILKAGRKGKTSEVSPAKGFTTTNPKTVYNEACLLREKICPVSPMQALLNLDNFYASKAVDAQVITESSDLRETILNFAVKNLFPENEKMTFYVFSADDRERLLKNKDELIPTELLRDLWNIMPERTLPLSKDGVNNVVIDRNMTIGQLTQGLSILVQNKAEDRLKIQNALIETKEKDSYEILKDKIKSEILRLEVKPRSHSQQTLKFDLLVYFLIYCAFLRE